ncbi:RNA polymerase, sigma-24 subunit, ECF subfamily [[Leptolyngbya] sp. PCC 7376]|uniref:sigma-70 family RNA polymerase sigma factor n=1 Tax=[Leptolyngbya] sp. PCC 7376 TaxID=111781 RepID=UPI00029EC986|nr:sigma-70 family RNA polymerase sigma factor [[Leptolyngbya] sp. PCC 7376]AFY40671.1 RNA polymerase, sigma-24 subunit, ECF subfamily [[Leptolyngbya] sp. PCC 7376]
MANSKNLTPQCFEDIDLMQKIAQQEQAALGQLYDRYARIMYSLAYKMLGTAEEAEEVVLDVFSQVWRTADRYDAQRGRTDSWLFLLTRSRALDRLRRRKRNSNVVEAAISEAKVPVTRAGRSPEEMLLIKDRRQQVKIALAQIPPEQQQIIELAYYQGLSQSQIAKQTGISLGTVKTRVRLGLSKLKVLLQDMELDAK